MSSRYSWFLYVYIRNVLSFKQLEVKLQWVKGVGKGLLTDTGMFISKNAAVMKALSVTSSDTPPCREEAWVTGDLILIPLMWPWVKWSCWNIIKGIKWFPVMETIPSTDNPAKPTEPQHSAAFSGFQLFSGWYRGVLIDLTDHPHCNLKHKLPAHYLI